MVYPVLKNDSELIGVKRKAMCQYTCCSCGNPIKKGEVYDSAYGMTPASRDYDGDYLKPQYWTYRTHLYCCDTPLPCQVDMHNFVYREQSGDPDDIFSDYKEEGEFCTECFIKKPIL